MQSRIFVPEDVIFLKMYHKICGIHVFYLTKMAFSGIFFDFFSFFIQSKRIPHFLVIFLFLRQKKTA